MHVPHGVPCPVWSRDFSYKSDAEHSSPVSPIRVRHDHPNHVVFVDDLPTIHCKLKSIKLFSLTGSFEIIHQSFSLPGPWSSLLTDNNRVRVLNSRAAGPE